MAMITMLNKFMQAIADHDITRALEILLNLDPNNSLITNPDNILPNLDLSDPWNVLLLDKIEQTGFWTVEDFNHYRFSNYLYNDDLQNAKRYLDRGIINNLIEDHTCYTDQIVNSNDIHR